LASPSDFRWLLFYSPSDFFQLVPSFIPGFIPGLKPLRLLSLTLVHRGLPSHTLVHSPLVDSLLVLSRTSLLISSPNIALFSLCSSPGLLSLKNPSQITDIILLPDSVSRLTPCSVSFSYTDFHAYQRSFLYAYQRLRIPAFDVCQRPFLCSPNIALFSLSHTSV